VQYITKTFGGFYAPAIEGRDVWPFFVGFKVEFNCIAGSKVAISAPRDMVAVIINFGHNIVPFGSEISIKRKYEFGSVALDACIDST